MTHRSRNDLISDILKAANGRGATRTKIMYRAFLGYDKLKDHLTVLTQTDLLRYDLDKQTFKTTEKGLRFLDAYNHMDAVMKAKK